MGSTATGEAPTLLRLPRYFRPAVPSTGATFSSTRRVRTRATPHGSTGPVSKSYNTHYSSDLLRDRSGGQDHGGAPTASSRTSCSPGAPARRRVARGAAGQCGTPVCTVRRDAQFPQRVFYSREAVRERPLQPRRAQGEHTPDQQPLPRVPWRLFVVSLLMRLAASLLGVISPFLLRDILDGALDQNVYSPCSTTGTMACPSSLDAGVAARA